jgi:acyl carrier protein
MLVSSRAVDHKGNAAETRKTLFAVCRYSSESRMKRMPGASKEVVRHRLADLLEEIGGVPRSQITDGATIDRELQMESVALIELQVALEDEFDIEIDPIEVVELNEFAAIANYVYDRVTARS